MTFYEYFRQLCDERGESPTYVVTQIGLSTPNATYWKNGSMPKNDTLRKLADYFGVTERALTDQTEELKGEQKKTFIERCKELDFSYEDSDKFLAFGDVNYLKKIIDGRIRSTTDCVKHLADHLGISTAYLLGTSDNPRYGTIKRSNNLSDEVDVILTTLHLRKLLEDDLHQQCSIADAEVVAALIFDFIGPSNLVPLGWAVDALLHGEGKKTSEECKMWGAIFSEFLKYHYAYGGKLNKLQSIAGEKQVLILPARFDKEGQDGFFCVTMLDRETVLSDGDLSLDELERFLLNTEDPYKQKKPQDQNDPETKE